MTDDRLPRATALALWERIARQLDENRSRAREDDPEDYDGEGFRHTEYCNVHDMLRYGLTIGDVCTLYLSWDCELPREVTDHMHSLGITIKTK